MRQKPALGPATIHLAEESANRRSGGFSLPDVSHYRKLVLLSPRRFMRSQDRRWRAAFFFESMMQFHRFAL
jgi:hypothetical protein